MTQLVSGFLFETQRKGGAERANENAHSLCTSASLRFKKEPANSLPLAGCSLLVFHCKWCNAPAAKSRKSI